ncbi:MAG: hypothetical protein LBL45_02110 [Treponema sp.]|nr:hypothetical protein [Treponema sp.]
MADYFLEQGGTYFHTAYIHHMGNSEAIRSRHVMRLRLTMTSRSSPWNR